MRIKSVISDVQREHLNDLRRRYPLIEGTNRGWSGPGLATDREFNDNQSIPLNSKPSD